MLVTCRFLNMSFTHVPGITITICALYPSILMCILKIKPVYQSITALIFNGMVNCNTVICLISLGTMTIEQVSPYHQYTTRRFRATIIPICLIIILYWWRAQISKTIGKSCVFSKYRLYALPSQKIKPI